MNPNAECNKMPPDVLEAGVQIVPTEEKTGIIFCDFRCFGWGIYERFKSGQQGNVFPPCGILDEVMAYEK